MCVLFFKIICLFERKSYRGRGETEERESEREINSSTGSLQKWPKYLELGQSKARVQQYPSVYFACEQGPRPGSFSTAFLGTLTGIGIISGAAGIQIHYSYGNHRWLYNTLCHNTGFKSCIF